MIFDANNTNGPLNFYQVGDVVVLKVVSVSKEDWDTIYSIQGVINADHLKSALFIQFKDEDHASDWVRCLHVAELVLPNIQAIITKESKQ